MHGMDTTTVTPRDGDPFGPCGWAVERTEVIYDEEYGPEPYTTVEECGAPAFYAFGGEGWRCEAGHFHEPISRAWLPGSLTSRLDGDLEGSGRWDGEEA